MGIKAIGDECFWASDVEEVLLPDGLVDIRRYAFFHCEDLVSIVIPDSVEFIDYFAFSGCYKLKSIKLPKNIKSVKWLAFGFCSDLTKVIIDDNIGTFKVKDDVIFDKDFKTLLYYPCGKKGESYKIPDGVTKIGEGAFVSCLNLKNINISDSVTEIDIMNFNSCNNLKSVKITNSVKNIGGGGSFECCDNLKDIYFTGTEEEWLSIEGISDKEYLEGASIHYNCSSSDTIDIEKEVRKLLSEGKSEKEVYKALKSKSNIADKDIVDALLRIDSTSPMVVSFCDKVILPDISSLFQKSGGVSKYTIGEVANILYNKYPRALVNEAIVKVLHNEYLVD